MMRERESVKSVLTARFDDDDNDDDRGWGITGIYFLDKVSPVMRMV